MSDTLLKRARDLTAAYSIRPGLATDGDAQAFVNLFNETYSRHVSTAYYYWQFFEAPLPGVCLIAAAHDQIGGVYGLRCLHPSDPSIAMIGQAVDLIVTTGLRGTGLWLRLELEMEQWARAHGCAALYAMPNAAAYQSRVSHLDWCPLGERVAYVAQTWSRRGQFNLDFEPVAAFGPETRQITQSFSDQHPQLIWFGRVPDDLNWRFANNPAHRYKLILVRRDNRPWAYLVLKIYQDPLTAKKSGDIVDVMWSDDDPDALTELLSFALDQFDQSGVSQSTMWLDTGTVLDGVARAAGFGPSDQLRNLACKVFEPSASYLADKSRWLISLSDSEIY